MVDEKTTEDIENKVEEEVKTKKYSEDEKIWAILSYMGPLALLAYFLKKESEFVQFHAKQGIVLLIGEFFVGFPLFGLIIGLIVFILWIMGIISALQNKMEPLPIVKDVVEKLKI